MSQPAPPSEGLVIAGRYQLVRLIGRGGMGSVWEARHTSLGTPVAIKFIEAEYSDSLEARSRFIKEAKAAANIQSKHAIQIHDHDITEDGKPYIVMELLRGEPLDKRIDRLGRLTLQDTARILQQVCRALARAHERGIIHRDLKPENIFLVHTPEDDEEIAKVLDFGIAKMQDPNNPAVTSSTKTGAVLGTPFYMSPEQARGLRNVDHRTDIWSLGVIAFKCLTGHLPFDGESVGDLLVKICTSPVPVPSHVAPGLPPAFDAWFMRALDREPQRRFSSVVELSDALGYAAGLAPRGPGSAQRSAPSGNVRATLPTPHGHVQSYRQSPQPDVGLTPAPGAMTAAPFTSSQPVPGLPSPRAKYVALAAVLSFTLGGGGAAAYVYKQRHDAAKATGGTAAPPSAVPVTALSADKAVTVPPAIPAPPLPLAKPNAAPLPAPVPVPVPGKSAVAPAPAPSGKPAKPATSPAAPPPPDKPPQLPPPPTHPKPPAPPRNDPGY